MGGHHRGAEIAAGEMGEIDAELDEEGAVEPELGPHPRHHLGRGVIAGDGDHRVDRHPAPDEKSDEDEAEQGERDRGERPREGAQPGEPPPAPHPGQRAWHPPQPLVMAA